ncbi:STELLO glycosyltransferase family protein [Candidatus Cyanaurora vandensis]|uniref:STELLO glycosyltransferase family protein n=1 Tax=Candidatus Cyanaurora vandensis TaxID=2714958 RepID=UPI00257EAA4E|nr:STELLO glycosyltransferase family protein [Candidatus Cyanaurora vandensis]
MSKFIVITSIFAPTEAVIKFSREQDYQLIVVGDKKTPPNWVCENVTYLSVEHQAQLGFELNQHLPYNHYCRKMLGYLYALTHKADVIIDTDDDNIPNENWCFPAFMGTYQVLPEDLGFINIYELYTNQKIWPRGYPLKYLNTDRTVTQQGMIDQQVKVGIWQGLANEDPDVDAIYRLTSDKMCIFQDNGSYVLGKNTITPFNSQNTAFCKELFALLYLPSFVTFRFTDILRGLVAQPIMWLYNFNLGFLNATVTQKRNPHDYMKDFESEIPMYLYADRIIELITPSLSASQSIEDNLYVAYEQLQRVNIVSNQEMKTLEVWLSDYKAHCG